MHNGFILIAEIGGGGGGGGGRFDVSLEVLCQRSKHQIFVEMVWRESSDDGDGGESPEDGVFFRRQLLILCDSKGPYLPGPR